MNENENYYKRNNENFYLGKPYSNIVPIWSDTAMRTQTGF